MQHTGWRSLHVPLFREKLCRSRRGSLEYVCSSEVLNKLVDVDVVVAVRVQF